MDVFALIAEKRIQEAIDRGELDNLAGKGKPLNLEDPPPFVARETWLAMKIMKDAGVVPEEVSLIHKTLGIKEALRGAQTDRERHLLVKELRDAEIELRERLAQRRRG